MDSEQLAEALDFLQEHRAEFHLHSMLILRHGYIVADAYFYPFVSGLKHDLTSMTKSFTAMLTGIAIGSCHKAVDAVIAFRSSPEL